MIKLLKKFYYFIFKNKEYKKMYGFVSYDDNGKESLRSEAFTSFVVSKHTQSPNTLKTYGGVNSKNTWVAIALVPTKPMTIGFPMAVPYGVYFNTSNNSLEIDNRTDSNIDLVIGVFK